MQNVNRCKLLTVIDLLLIYHRKRSQCRAESLVQKPVRAADLILEPCFWSWGLATGGQDLTTCFTGEPPPCIMSTFLSSKLRPEPQTNVDKVTWNAFNIKHAAHIVQPRQRKHDIFFVVNHLSRSTPWESASDLPLLLCSSVFILQKRLMTLWNITFHFLLYQTHFSWVFHWTLREWQRY